MAGRFAEGLVQGLITGNELQDKRDERKRQAALDFANTAAAQQRMNLEEQRAARDEEKFGWEREAQEKQKKMAEEIRDLTAQTYFDKEEEVEEPSAIPGQPGQKRKVIKSVRMGQDGIYDMHYFTKLGQVYMKHGDPENLKKMVEYGKYYEKQGVMDALAEAVSTNGKNVQKLQYLAPKFGLKEGSIGMSPDKNGSWVLTGTTTDGQQVSRPMNDAMMIMGVTALTDIENSRLGQEKTRAEINKYKADANRDNAYAEGVRSGKFGGGGASANPRNEDYYLMEGLLGKQRYKLPEFVNPLNKNEPVDDPEGESIVREIASGLIDKGQNGSSAYTQANKRLAERNALAQRNLSVMIEDAKKNPQAYGLKSPRDAERREWQQQQFLNIRRALQN